MASEPFAGIVSRQWRARTPLAARSPNRNPMPFLKPRAFLGDPADHHHAGRTGTSRLRQLFPLQDGLCSRCPLMAILLCTKWVTPGGALGITCRRRCPTSCAASRGSDVRDHGRGDPAVKGPLTGATHRHWRRRARWPGWPWPSRFSSNGLAISPVQPLSAVGSRGQLHLCYAILQARPARRLATRAGEAT